MKAESIVPNSANTYVDVYALYLLEVLACYAKLEAD